MNSLTKDLSTPPDVAARRLLGSYLTRFIDGQEIVCSIVETEAYDQDEPASHSYRGVTPRTEVMFGSAGYAYVYFTYGMHYCLNVVTGSENHGSAVLIRALQPIKGLDIIKANRQKITSELMLTNGPGKLCQALAIGREFSGHDLTKSPVILTLRPALESKDIKSSPRIGISQAKNIKWRFYIKDNPYVSRVSS
ncbi:MAG TPA: DNA-3-methyladenine glycosylase [Candidatus Saccharimonadales bacterium]|jgi:DNA-3-methyladenine glycosylase